MAKKTPIYLSTAGTHFSYGVETVSGTKPESFTELQGATSISEISSERETIEVTPLSAEEYKEFVDGLADPGGTWEIGFNESDVFHEEWDALVSAATTAKASGLRVWFQVTTKLKDSFFVVGTPNGLGFGGADVNGALTTTGRITINQVKGWDTTVAITE